MQLNELFYKKIEEINTYVENGNYEVTLKSWEQVLDKNGKERLELTYEFPDGATKSDTFSLEIIGKTSIAQKILSYLFRLTNVNERECSVIDSLNKIINEKRKFCVAVYEENGYQNTKLIANLDEVVKPKQIATVQAQLTEALNDDLPF